MQRATKILLYRQHFKKELACLLLIFFFAFPPLHYYDWLLWAYNFHWIVNVPAAIHFPSLWVIFIILTYHFLVLYFLMSACDIPCQLDDVSLPLNLDISCLLSCWCFHGSATLKKAIPYVLKACFLPTTATTSTQCRFVHKPKRNLLSAPWKIQLAEGNPISVSPSWWNERRH